MATLYLGVHVYIKIVIKAIIGNNCDQMHYD